jgi:hypothetical protein
MRRKGCLHSESRYCEGGVLWRIYAVFIFGGLIMPLTNIMYVESDIFKSVAAELIADGKSSIEEEIQALNEFGIAVEVCEMERLVDEFKYNKKGKQNERKN